MKIELRRYDFDVYAYVFLLLLSSIIYPGETYVRIVCVIYFWIVRVFFLVTPKSKNFRVEISFFFSYSSH